MVMDTHGFPIAKINGLARHMFDDAARQLGRKAATSVKKANLGQLARFVKSHPISFLSGYSARVDAFGFYRL
jgi:hypothetical protein